MKKLCYILLAALLASCAGNQVWEQPEYLYDDSSLNITSVELQKERTILHATVSGQPGSNFRIASNAFLVGDNGQRCALTGGEGLTPGKWTPFSEEGNSFDLYFEPLKGRRRAIDFIEPGGWKIYGIHEAGKPLKIKPAKEEKAAVRDEAAFFQKGVGTLTGQFEDPAHPNLIEYFGRNAFQENNNQSVSIAEDGSFSMEIPLEHSVFSYVWDEHATAYYFFLQPDGQTRMRIDAAGRVHYSSDSRCGKLAEWMSNEAPRGFSILKLLSEEEQQTISISDYMARVASHYETVQTLADYICARERFSQEEAHLLKQHIRILAATDEMSAGIYLMRSFMMNSDPLDSLSVIRQKDLADPAKYISMAQLDPTDWTAFSLVNDISTLSNYYEFGPWSWYDIPRMVAADTAIFHQSEPSIFLQAALMNQGQLSSEIKQQNAFLKQSEADDQKLELVDFYQKKWEATLSALTSPDLRARYQTMMDELLAEQEGRYDLPEGEATDIFRKLVEPFRGKWVYIDFWATSCGPCRSGIESSTDERKKLAGRDDIKLVFITGDRITPPEAYREYVDENLEGEVSYLLPKAQYVQLSTLFKFSSIPHNELVDPDGRIVCGKELPRLGPGFIEQIESLISE